jgi:hypothetical protein
MSIPSDFHPSRVSPVLRLMGVSVHIRLTLNRSDSRLRLARAVRKPGAVGSIIYAEEILHLVDASLIGLSHPTA